MTVAEGGGGGIYKTTEIVLACEIENNPSKHDLNQSLVPRMQGVELKNNTMPLDYLD
ncbi:hypothetical protein CC1G_15234 [Coprinopsis cinerea okayama7|uniref:Uncharacterized protein n=1 Tax=Coprinopsis cinerea (strain Okayama-7 / 130 / ATCC MYA-4618 / FGSC 9003) TaxID=240176 RepID=D6RQ59_COPC7|nr:hypothetical protein CC1G_15234 [Coprinopsis cinerea okayama7\|eukprot:XP_002910326.1 hypothetical protein CC1G_15234 [Coprinopsis cinerea okayama7\